MILLQLQAIHMPTYSYQCQACGYEFQTLERMSAEPRRACPSCGGRVERRITGGAGLVLKGSAEAAPPGPCGGGGACGCR
jgi:putative FmdB family regulatory protein